jgi:PAS domain S-box-containing protein
MPMSQEHLLWHFMDLAPVPLVVTDDDRAVKRVNGSWTELCGYTSDQATRMRIDDMLAPESRPGISMRWSDLLSAGAATARIAIVCADGTRLEVRYSSVANAVPGRHLSIFLGEHAPPPGMMRSSRGRRAGQLTLREQESLRLVALGMTTTTAAERLGISPETVRTHVRNAMNKLGARTRAQAIAVAMRDGEIPN